MSTLLALTSGISIEHSHNNNYPDIGSRPVQKVIVEESIEHKLVKKVIWIYIQEENYRAERTSTVTIRERADIYYNTVKPSFSKLIAFRVLLLYVITKTGLYNFDPLKPHFCIVKLGFTGVYIIFLISAQNHRLWVLVRTALARRF